MVAQKREIHIEMSRDTLLFTLHESCIAMTNAILPKCVSTYYDIKDTLLFLEHLRYITTTSPLHHNALAERVVQNAGAHTITSRETLFI